MQFAVAPPSPSMFAPSPRPLSPVFCKCATSPPPPPALSPSPPAFPLQHVRKPPEAVESPKESSMLKRKRSLLGLDSMRIDITRPILGFESWGAAPEIDSWREVESERDGYSVCCKKGKRAGVMEDRYAAVVGLQGDSKQAFFGVFDGHGGIQAAEFAAEHLHKNVMKVVTEKGEEIERAVKEGYLTTDAEFLKKDIGSGTCAVTAFIHEGHLVVSNAGDCRAVLSRGGVAEALTVDHRASLLEERQRIQSLGGFLFYAHGVWRVNGSLAVSRAIGDRDHKESVIADPETKVLEISPECEFLILASDGLWDSVGNQEAVDLVRSLCVGVDKQEPLSACKKLVDLSLKRGCLDDVSVMVVQLTRFLQ
ncbi:phosphatase 2C family protein [Striga asiatica]|uniref:protein-serine/threonine phosphatase n=1 Tax=Striga asiatica TaxID=4170 RepID=A0A5A7QZU9_STRAF|nr:phosphatase 2C family protein [Striga asiatica]